MGFRLVLEVNKIKERFKQLRKTLGLSQDEFGAKLGLSRGAVVNVELHGMEPKPSFINLVCSTYNVNRDWLLTGEGEMFNQMTRSEQIAAFAGKVLAGDESDFRFRFIDAITKMTDEQWDGLEQVINSIAGNKKASDS